MIFYPSSPVCCYRRFTWHNMAFDMKILLLAAATSSEFQYQKHTLLRDNLLRSNTLTDNFQVNVF